MGRLQAGHAAIQLHHLLTFPDHVRTPTGETLPLTDRPADRKLPMFTDRVVHMSE